MINFSDFCKIQCPILQRRVCRQKLQCKKALHHWSVALNSPFTLGRNTTAIKICLEHYHVSWKFQSSMLDSPIWIPTIFHIVTDLSAYYQDRTVLGHALMLVSEKKWCVLLAAFWVKIQQLGWIAYYTAPGNVLLCTPHLALMRVTCYGATYRMRETKPNCLNYRDFPLNVWKCQGTMPVLVPSRQLPFSSEPFT